MEIERLRDFILNLLRNELSLKRIKGKQSDIQICRKIISYQYFKIKLVQYTCNCSGYLSGYLHIFWKCQARGVYYFCQIQPYIRLGIWNMQRNIFVIFYTVTMLKRYVLFHLFLIYWRFSAAKYYVTSSIIVSAVRYICLKFKNSLYNIDTIELLQVIRNLFVRNKL